MSSTAIDLAQFAIYELSRVLDRLEEEADAHPDAPGLSALRAATSACLSWDHCYHAAWDDPSFSAQHFALRGYIVASCPESPTAAEVVLPMRALLEKARTAASE